MRARQVSVQKTVRIEFTAKNVLTYKEFALVVGV